MIPALLAAKTFAASWWKAALGFILAAPLFFVLGQCDGRKTERKVQAAARAEANVEALKKGQVASNKAADQRVIDATTVAANEEELIDAIADTPDTAPDVVRVALGCRRLLQQGTNPADLPATCRTSGGNQAGSTP